MTFADVANAVFEGGLAVMIGNNIRALYRDKRVRGVSLLTTAWVTAWGFWNLYFYPAVNAWFSFYAGIGVVLANAVWLGLALYYATADERASRRQFEAAMGGRPEDNQCLICACLGRVCSRCRPGVPRG